MVGELCNIILGQAKLTLLGLGYEIKQANPTVITGKDHKVKYFSSTATIVLPFKVDDSEFFVQICSAKVDEKDLDGKKAA